MAVGAYPWPKQTGVGCVWCLPINACSAPTEHPWQNPQPQTEGALVRDGVEENGQFVRQLWLCEEIKHPEKWGAAPKGLWGLVVFSWWDENWMEWSTALCQGRSRVRAALSPMWDEFRCVSAQCLRVVGHKNWGTDLNNHPCLWKCCWITNCIGWQVCVWNNMQFKLGQNTLL